MPYPLWPLFDLRIRTPRVELRYPTDEDLAEVVEVARTGVHDPGVMPFRLPWTRKESPEFERLILQLHWKFRADWVVDDWTLPFAVVVDGKIAGKQNMMAKDFVTCREAETSSWLAAEWQGKGIGTEMRAAILAFAFECLDATDLFTYSFDWNQLSLGVTRSLAYEANGEERVAVEGKATRHLNFRLTRQRWEELVRHRFEVTVEGFEGCRDLFGLSS